MHAFRYLLLSFLLGIYSLLSFGEIVFSDTLGTADCYEESYSLMPFQNGYLCVAAQLCPNGSGEWKNRWFVLDENGDSIETQFNDYSGFAKKLNNGDFLVYGGEKAGLVYDTVYLHRINGQGQWLWTRKSYLPACRNAVNDIAEDDAGNIYAIGTYGTGNCSQPAFESFLLKYNDAGTLLWQKTYNKDSFSSLQFYDLKIEGNTIYSAGFIDSIGNFRKCYFNKMDTSGNILWEKTIALVGGNLNAYSIEKFQEQLYILAYSDSLHLFITDLEGQIQNNTSLGASCGSRYFHVEKSLDGFLLVLANKQIDFNCSSTFSKLDSTGALIWEKNFGGLLRHFSEIDSGSFLLSGYSGFLPKAKVLRFDTNYISRPPFYNSIEIQKQAAIKVFPNPSSGMFYLENENELPADKIELFDLNGKLLKDWGNNFHSKTYQLTPQIEDGIYALRIQYKDQPSVLKKLVVLR